MIPVSNEYRRQLIAGNRNWLIKVPVYLNGNVSGTPDFTLTNEHIWDNGIVIDEATSSDDTFDIGAAIVGSLKVVIDNINGDFSQYDFYDAKITLYLGVTGDVDDNDVQRYYRIGFYVVDTPTYNGSLITLNCLDNMTWFDVPFEEVTGISYPTNAGTLVNEICSHVGVFLANPSFPNYTTSIESAPEQKLNCREVIQYVAQMCCCYCKIDRAGELYLGWYDKNAIIGLTNYDGGSFSTTTTPYSDGCDLDGGHFVPWDGDSADGGTFQDLLDGAWISSNFQIEVSTDDVVVTGCRVRNTTKKDDSYDELWVDPVVEQDHDRYVLVIENNPFINKDNAASIANVVGSTLAGLPMRGYTATSLADFSYETGDMATVVDFRGNHYYSWITHFTFTTNNSENFSCGVESLRKRSEERFSGTVKTLAEANENATAILSDYDNAQAAMNELAQNALSYKKYEATVSGGLVTWLYNGTTVDTNPPASSTNPYFPSSTVVFKISGDGVFVAQDDDIDPVTGEVLRYSSGYDANSGTAILNLIYAHGINCDWIHTGTLTLGGQNNTNGVLRILNASGTQIGSWDNSGINASAGTFSGTLNAAKGTISDGVGTLSISSGDLNITNGLGGSGTGGAGVFARKTGTDYYACWGAVNSAARKSSSQYIETPTWNVIQAGINASDRRLKKNIKDLDVNFAKRLILGIKPKSFRFKKNKKLPDGLHFGVIAQDVKQIEEECGIDTDNRLFYVENDGTYAVDYRQLIAPMIKVIQEQQKEIELLKQKVGV